MKRKELRAYLGVTVWNGDKDHDADVYVKSLADSVMDEYEENIKELNKQLEDAENAYYSLKMDTENRIKELEGCVRELKLALDIANNEITRINNYSFVLEERLATYEQADGSKPQGENVKTKEGK